VSVIATNELDINPRSFTLTSCFTSLPDTDRKPGKTLRNL
jgi:hypothetical protein